VIEDALIGCRNGRVTSAPRSASFTANHRIAVVALALALGSLGLVARPAPAGAASSPSRIWVASGGDDNAAGTQDAPVATLTRARDLVRSARADDPNRDVVVEVGDGVLRLDRPLTLGPKDSGTRAHPVVYEAAPGAHAAISGARRVPNSAWRRDPDRPGVWRAHVGDVATRDLFVDGTPAVRARTESNPSGFRPQWNAGGADSGIAFLPTDLNPANYRDPTTWQGIDHVEAVANLQWKQAMVPVTGVTAPRGDTPGLLTMAPAAWANANLFRSPTDPNQITIWSFFAVDHFENSLSFLDAPREWYLDRAHGELYYQPAPWEDMSRVDVELPVLETLVRGQGTGTKPLHDVTFRNLAFTGATWNAPSGPQGFVEDQAGFRIVGNACAPNTFGHCQDPEPTPGNLEFDHAQRLRFERNAFADLGATALRLGTGTQDTLVAGNTFAQIGSAAVALGGISAADHHPADDSQTTRDDTITRNLVQHTGLGYAGAPAINVGFALRLRVTENVIRSVPWAGISVGWGWGLLDPGGYPGVPGATQGMWGDWPTPTINRNAVIADNDISDWQRVLNDTGAIYTTGMQGSSFDDGMAISANFAHDRAPAAFGNTFYNDGGSRWVTVKGNTSANNPINTTRLAPPSIAGDPLPLSPAFQLVNGLPYGSDIGGCRTYGDIRYLDNRWFQPPVQAQIVAGALEYAAIGDLTALVGKVDAQVPQPYSPDGFFNICPFTFDGVSHPSNLTFAGNTVLPG
jgi:hypothetical protein